MVEGFTAGESASSLAGLLDPATVFCPQDVRRPGCDRTNFWSRPRPFAQESSLPLGLAADIIYSESTFHLTKNDQLTLVTDGVVEARDKKGELFGFQRTSGITTLDANHIAHAAQQFGQEDDITVLCLKRQRTGKEVASIYEPPEFTSAPA